MHQIDKRRYAQVLLGLMALAVLAGCEARLSVVNDGVADGGIVIVLPGIDGRAPHNEAVARAFCKDDIGMAVEIFDWTVPAAPLINQAAIGRNREMAAALAARVTEHQRNHPGRPVFLVGHSGGTAIAVWAAEALLGSAQIDGIILLASSLSPEYDLSKALARTRRGIVSFHSPHDSVLLDLGTTLFGTMDRKHTVAAGNVGFRPVAGRGREYAKLRQVAWHRDMARVGHDGGHFSVCSRDFILAYVAPLAKVSGWDGATVARVGSGGPEVLAALLTPGN
jgi:pimeloyl-ACP methyl ester carboxylesterase